VIVMRARKGQILLYCTAAFCDLCPAAVAAYASLTGCDYPEAVFFEGTFVAKALSLNIVNDPVAPRAAALLLVVLVLITSLMGAVPG
jgi:hypothetical protein